MLAQNHRIPSVLFLSNNAAGSQDIIQALGRLRVLIGMPNAGGERRGHVVRYVWWRRLALMFGELVDLPTSRTDTILRLFRSAGLPARVVKNVDAYQKTHVAGVPSLAGAIYMAGGDIRRLADMPEVLRLYVRAFREALRALRAVGIPLKPSATRLVERIPEAILVLALRLFNRTRLAVVGAEAHANAAPDEMKELGDELKVILRQSGLPSPASDALFAQVEARFQTAGCGLTNGAPSRSVS